MNTVRTPLFPLHTVLFPGGPLPLRIFESRYLQMISDCLKTDSGFGVCLISAGREVGEAAETYEVGTLARITDWNMRQDGLLGITAQGEQRFRIRSVEVQANKLAIAEAELLAVEPKMDLPDQYMPLVDLLRRMLEQAGQYYSGVPRKYADASWVSFRLAELLPVNMATKQCLLEMNEPLKRLEHLFGMLQGLEVL
jgi:Lon protease-like protein